MVAESGGRFKIGHSTDIAFRSERVERYIDTKRSWAAYFADGELARRCENLLHAHFARDRHPPMSGDGGTEWFYIAALEEVERYVDDNQNRLEWVEKKAGAEIFMKPVMGMAQRRAKTRADRVSLPIWVLDHQRVKLKTEAAQRKTTVQQIVQDLINAWEAELNETALPKAE